MDFYRICVRETKGAQEIFPDFTVGRSRDLMVRGKSFYAIWDEKVGLWSTDEYDVQRLVDEELDAFAQKAKDDTGLTYNVKHLRSFSSNGWSQFRKYMQNISDNSHQLDDNLTFANMETKKTDYVSRRLPYPLAPGDHSAWDELIGTLYAEEERAKIEWAIGAVVSGDSKKIQKFLVLYGPGGTGKSTILNIIQALFEGYTTTFEAKALGSNNGSFATESFKNNPLVAIQHDGDLSNIQDNTRLNSIISHEEMTMNEKYKPSYTSRINAFLFMGTNLPVKISDAKSGIIRRLIDVHPTGNLIPANHYHTLMSRIEFELGAIAHHCLEVYREMGKNYYNSYRPVEMMLQTDVFFNFIEYYFDVFKDQDGATLKQAYTFYKEFCAETGVERMLPQYKVREELRNYFDNFQDRVTIGGVLYRSYYSGFNANKFKAPVSDDAKVFSLVVDENESLFDDLASGWPAQYSRITPDGLQIPNGPWDKVDTTLSDLDTSELHYVRVPENHIVIDFDLRDDSGEKSLDRNLAAASEWPATYAELSKGGNGVHLHYTYEGDVSELAAAYADGIEVKTLLGGASLRRRLTKCNNIPVATINSGLPFKEKKVLSENTIKSEKGLRDLIERNLRKEIHPGTKPSIDFIKKILDEAYESGMSYDVEEMRPRIIAFANNSTNQPLQCLKVVQQMRFQGDTPATPDPEKVPGGEAESAAAKAVLEAADERLVLYDIEVYPNLFVVCWKFEDAPVEQTVKMINPSAQDVEGLFRLKLVGYNNRRYDNHILYARFLGYNNEQLYNLSQKIINGDAGGMFGEAYNISYADIYDFSSKKQSLKKFQIELGIHHMELDLPWDQPVPPELVDKVVEYCCNDVVSTEAVLKARHQDFVARQILAELSGLTVNDTTQKHTAKIIFGGDRNPQASFVYTDLSKDFPGYVYDMGKSTYRGEVVGEGGYVYAEPGMYENVALLDVASMHPTSIIQLNLFGEYTPNFAALKDARMAIKHRDFAAARKMLGGKLTPFLDDEEHADDLAYALKIVINIVYGLTSAKFDNPFRDVRNKDNIVAKRGALFMIDLKHEVQARGFTVAHIKTDSIKIPNATPEIIDFVTEYGKKYGYDFEHEGTYERFCLVNDAVYIAFKDGHWDAVGAQFQHPYVYKTLFSKEDITWDDLCETKQVTQGAMYLDFAGEKPMHMADDKDLHFVGRTGRFVPVMPGSGGGILYRVKDDKQYAVTGTKGYLWLEAEVAKSMSDQIEIDMQYFDNLVDAARKTIEKFGEFKEFI
jgi:energy-coupling factor transporter ATP-binding protein EcfA2